ncbi:hypothetical protein EG68_12328 [Paragonimus skrjabini miyazakii]|uniref:Uncharacterized protein n=1 Tax=Paragonimus skrjabini miyazakii TaxID=59628 RepID=A0A8S9YNC0_9TREM|nr:hypothetical protein EG68_12328 [Paragonimus skrjabini miyazakii]
MGESPVYFLLLLSLACHFVHSLPVLETQDVSVAQMLPYFHRTELNSDRNVYPLNRKRWYHTTGGIYVDDPTDMFSRNMPHTDFLG